jgi:hypothetical protein
MPVTVKLSERFYQKFGHEVVDECRSNVFHGSHHQ